MIGTLQIGPIISILWYYFYHKTTGIIEIKVTIATLAIKGHPERGNEVIEILEMLGGNNKYHINITECNLLYTIREGDDAIIATYPNSNISKIYTLEEFLEKFPYKVGDKITVEHYKGIWEIIELLWSENLNIIYYGISNGKTKELVRVEEIKPYKEEIMEEDKKAKGYCTEEPEDSGKTKKIAWFTFWDNDFADEVELYLKDRELVQKDGKWFVVKKNSSQVNLKELERKLDEALAKETTESLNKWLDGEPQPKAPILSNRYDYAEGKCGYVIPNGYEFDSIKQGFQTEIILRPIKSQYPKTYEECCEVLSIAPYYNVKYHTFEHGFHELATSNKLLLLQDKLNILSKLLICRDAYWNIAGDWKPDWVNANERKYCIVNTEGNITKWVQKTTNKILAFPTEEMRDTFYENFKDLIEQCKELL